MRYFTILLLACFSFLAMGQAVAPLLTSVRHQEAPYNKYCPYYRYADGTLSAEPCVVGCVATSLEQVLSYYQRIVTLQDTLHGWTTPNYTIDDVLPGNSVDTRLIRDNYDDGCSSEEEIEAVARLSYYCGVAAQMMYGPDESASSIQNLVEPLKRAFGLGTVVCLDSYLYTPQAWRSILENEIRNGRPVYFTGNMQFLGGHAFVLDGLDESGNFHVNWAYGGYYDGYYPLEVLHPFEPLYDRTPYGDRYGFSCNTQALILHPDSIVLDLPDELQRTGLEIAIDSLRFMQEPEAGKFTELQVYLHNTSSDSLTTPFAILSNAPAATALFDQADVVGHISASIATDERVKVSGPLKFSKTGERVLRFNPADSILLGEYPFVVKPHQKAVPQFGELSVSFPHDGVAQIAVPISNEGAGRLGELITYCLFEGEVPESRDGDVRHPSICTLPAGGDMVDTVCFRGLKPGVDYTFMLRPSSWNVAAQCTFTMPNVSGIDCLTTKEGYRQESVYTLDGRRISVPSLPGIYIKDGKKRLIK